MSTRCFSKTRRKGTEVVEEGEDFKSYSVSGGGSFPGAVVGIISFIQNSRQIQLQHNKKKRNSN